MTDSPLPLCSKHESVDKLEVPIKIRCHMCSTSDPESFRDSFYADAQLCQECHENTSYCVICQAPI